MTIQVYTGPQKNMQNITKHDNGDGLITVAEMRRSLNATGEDYTLKDVQDMMKKG